MKATDIWNICSKAQTVFPSCLQAFVFFELQSKQVPITPEKCLRDLSSGNYFFNFFPLTHTY